MQIVYLVYQPTQVTGGNRVIFQHVNGLKSAGHHVEIWSPNKEGVIVFDNSVEVRHYVPSDLDAPEVVVACDPGFLPDLKEYRKKSANFLLLQHDIAWVLQQNGLIVSREYMDAVVADAKQLKLSVITVSKSLASLYSEKYGLPTLLVKNGINNKLFRPSPPLLTLSRSSLLLIYDSQSWKGFKECLELVNRVDQALSGNSTTLIMGASLPTPEHSAAIMGMLHSAVYLLNPIQSQLSSIYCSADVFISMSHKEGFGLPVLEAFSCGTAVATTDNQGNSMFTRDGQNCIILGEEPDLNAKKVAELIWNKDSRQNLIREGLRTAAKHGWKESINHLVDSLST